MELMGIYRFWNRITLKWIYQAEPLAMVTLFATLVGV